MKHLQEAITHLEQANTSFERYLKTVDIQHQGDKQLTKAAHIITNIRLLQSLMQEMNE